MSTACSPTRREVKGGLYSVEFITKTWNVMNYVSKLCSCIYRKGFPLVFTFFCLKKSFGGFATDIWLALILFSYEYIEYIPDVLDFSLHCKELYFM